MSIETDTQRAILQAQLQVLAEQARGIALRSQGLMSQLAALDAPAPLAELPADDPLPTAAM